jgi:hypothetical protein
MKVQIFTMKSHRNFFSILIKVFTKNNYNYESVLGNGHYLPGGGGSNAIKEKIMLSMRALSRLQMLSSFYLFSI